MNHPRHSEISTRVSREIKAPLSLALCLTFQSSTFTSSQLDWTPCIHDRMAANHPSAKAPAKTVVCPSLPRARQPIDDSQLNLGNLPPKLKPQDMKLNQNVR